MKPEEMVNIREKLKLTQTELGERLNRTKRFIIFRETGAVPIDKMLEYALRWLLHIATRRKKPGEN